MNLVMNRLGNLGNILLVLALIIGTNSVSMAQSKDKPNVLFIMIDDLKPALGCYGHTQVISPNIDKLASESVMFTRAYASVPTCGASRASLLSGMSPTQARFKNAKATVDVDAPNAKTLPQIFKENGYTTISNGKVFHTKMDKYKESWSKKPWRVAETPESKKAKGALLPETYKGKQLKLAEQADVDDFAYEDGQTLKRSIEDLRKLKKSGDPFFLACGFKKPHLPLYAPKKYWDMYERDEIQIATNRYFPKDGFNKYKAYNIVDDNTWKFDLGKKVKRNSEKHHRLVRHGYYACTSYIDQLVGYLLEELEALDLDKNTIVVLWGDHGHMNGEHELFGKHKTLDGGVRIPFMIRLPEVRDARTTDALFESIDVFPTLCEMANVPAPTNQLHGKSFVPLLEKKTDIIKNSVYTRYHAAETVITDRYAYTRFKTKEEMLFDYKTDPEENQNVAAYPEYKEVLDEMRVLLDQRIEAAKVDGIQ